MIPPGTQLRPTFDDPDEAERVGLVTQQHPQREGEGAGSYIHRLAVASGLVADDEPAREPGED